MQEWFFRFGMGFGTRFMKKVFLAIGAVSLLAGCARPPDAPPPPRDLAAQYLAKNGFRVVDLSQVMIIHIDASAQTTTDIPATVCQSAPWGGMFRADTAAGHSAIGVVCVEQDNSVVVPLQKIIE